VFWAGVQFAEQTGRHWISYNVTLRSLKSDRRVDDPARVAHWHLLAQLSDIAYQPDERKAHARCADGLERGGACASVRCAHFKAAAQSTERLSMQWAVFELAGGATGTELVVAFRGTSSVGDAGVDVAVYPTAAVSAAAAPPSADAKSSAAAQDAKDGGDPHFTGVQLHGGFWTMIVSEYGALMRVVEPHAARSPNATIHIVGHSLGGMRQRTVALCTAPSHCPPCPLCGTHYCAVLCCAVLCCAVLCCAVLCCAVLCCAVLCCQVRTRSVCIF
jgi:hypothetical protein